VTGHTSLSSMDKTIGGAILRRRDKGGVARQYADLVPPSPLRWSLDRPCAGTPVPACVAQDNSAAVFPFLSAFAMSAQIPTLLTCTPSGQGAK
jgi:hypothetical protein